MKVVGVDGCKAGWLAACLETDTNSLSFKTHRSFAELVDDYSADTFITVDIPIGLCDGPRGCDVQARKMLGPRKNSVFPATCRAVLACSTYEQARAASLAATGKSLSAQAFAISGKIKEVDDLMSPALQERIREVHPEVCFTGLAGAPMFFYKRDSAGYAERQSSLLSALPGVELPGQFAAGRHLKGVAADDLLDAVVAAWSASRVANGSAQVLPDIVETDARGLRMEMVC
ncbi:MAG: DUF429 domain-containing protein [Dehalococcoidia bacterium]